MQKFLRILMLAALMVPFASQAQTVVTIGNTASTSTQYTVPVNMWYNYSLTQQIYTADEIGVPGTITAIAVDYAYNSSFSMSGVQLYMKNVSKEGFTSTTDMEPVSSSDLVWTGTLTATATGWLTITLDTPFEYDGASNLLVCFYDPTSGYPGSSYKFRTTATTDYLGLAYYDDNNNPSLENISTFSGYKGRYQYRNNIQLTITEAEVSCYPVRGLAAVDSLTTSNSLTLNWVDTNNTGATYSIMRTTGTGAEADTAWFFANAGASSYAFSNLLANTSYKFSVVSRCSVTDSSRAANCTVRTLNDADTIRTFTASGTTKRGDLVFDTAARTITVPVWYTTSLSSGFSLSWTLASNAAAFIDTTGDGSYTCQVTTTTIKNYLRMNTPLTLRIKAEDRALYTDYTLLLQSEDCVKDRNFALSAERIRYTATWDNPDTSVTNHYFIHSTTRLSAEELAAADYVTVTGAHQYTVEGLSRGTQYYAYLKAACDTAWLEDSVTTQNLANSLEIIIADGTTTNANLPVWGNWADAVQHSQSIYPASLLTDLMGQTFSSITYYMTTTTDPAWRNGTWEVSIGTTEQESYASSAAYLTEGLTMVHNGTLTSDAGKIIVEFNQPFTYNGGNLVIDFNLPAATTYDNRSFYGITQTSASTYARSGNTPSATSFLPKFSVSVALTPNACPEVTAIATDSLSHDFARISWTAADADYCVGNQIIVSATMLDSAALEAATPVALAATATSYDASGLTPDHDYYVYIKALCNGTEHPEGTSGWAAYEFHTYPTVRTPEIVAADFTGKHKATLYVANTGANVGQPVNYDYIASTTLLDAAALAAATPTATGIDTMIFDVDNLASATQYFFYVRNVMGTDVSPWSAPDSVTMPVAMPKPLHLQASNVAHNALTALWVRDDANYADETAWRAAIVLHGQQPAAADWLTTTDMEESSVVLGYHVFIGLITDTAYDIYVAAFDAATGATSDTVVLDSVRTAKFPGNGIIVANGTATNSYVMLRTVYQDTDHRSQVIYPANMLTSLQGKTMTAMRFYTNYTSSIRVGYGDWTENNFVLKLAVTTNENLASAWDATEGDTVFNGSISTVVEDGQLVFNFDTPFQYNGGNLLVELLYDDSFGDRYTTGSFYGIDAASASRYANGSTALTTATGTVQNFLPKVMIDYEGASTCLPVTTLYVEDLTYQSADLLWYPGNEETSWQYVVSTSDSLTAAELEAAALPVQSNNIALTGLMNDTAYTFYIRPVCSENENGSWNNFGFETQHADFYDVTVVVNDETMGTAAGLTGILAGTDTTIVATANAGYEFYKWTVNGLENYSDTLFLSVDSNITVNAYFKYAEATIAASAVTYWVGTGSNQAVVAVNWTDTALAWGVRFSAENITVQAAMDSIAAADPRFSYTLDDYGYLDNILFAENGDTLSKVMYSYWESKNNGLTDMGLYQPLANGDFEKWAEPAAGFVYDSMFYEYEYNNETYTYTSYLYAYPMAIYPVTAPVFYTVTVSYDETLGEVNGIPEAPVFAGTEITLTAEAEDYAHFVAWTYGENVDSNETLVVTVNSDLTINAVFAYNPVHVTYAVNDATMGSVDPSGVQTYEVGDIMTVTATANEGYHLSGWSMQRNGTVTTVTDLGATFTDTVTPLHEGTVITAIFEANPVVETYTVTVNYDATMGLVRGVPTEAVEAGSEVTLTAAPNTGYDFVAWVKGTDTVSRTATYTFTVNENITLTAVFKSTTTGIADVEGIDAQIYSTDSRIVVKGAENLNVYVYDVNGRVVRSQAKAAETIEFTMQNTGVYLVKVGNAPAKRVVVVR